MSIRFLVYSYSIVQYTTVQYNVHFCLRIGGYSLSQYRVRVDADASAKAKKRDRSCNVMQCMCVRVPVRVRAEAFVPVEHFYSTLLDQLDARRLGGLVSYLRKVHRGSHLLISHLSPRLITSVARILSTAQTRLKFSRPIRFDWPSFELVCADAIDERESLLRARNPKRGTTIHGLSNNIGDSAVQFIALHCNYSTCTRPDFEWLYYPNPDHLLRLLLSTGHSVLYITCGFHRDAARNHRWDREW